MKIIAIKCSTPYLLNSQVKMQGLTHFYRKKTTVARSQDWGWLNQPLGAIDVKCMSV